MISFQDRVRGVILSAALGDAMGAVVEKLSYEEIKEKYGRVESLHTAWYKADDPEENRGKIRGFGTVTDDTLMMLALIRVYLKEKRHLDAYDLGNEFMKEIAFRKTYIPEFGREAPLIERLFYPEQYMFTRHVLANGEPREAGIGNMVNCGAAMYIAPVGVVNAGNPKGAYDEAILFALGHQNSYGLEAAGVLAACVAKAFEENVQAEDIIQTAITFAKDGTKKAIIAISNEARSLNARNADKDEIVKHLHRVMADYSPMQDDVKRSIQKTGLPSSHYTPSRLLSIEELPMALAFILLNNGDYYSSIYDGINSGRDTDSIGVMIGVILGAMHGDKVMKQGDVDILEQRNRLNLLSISESFIQTSSEIIRKDLEMNRMRERILN